MTAPPPAVTLRPARPDDADALADFAARAFRETYRDTCRPADVEAHVAVHLTRPAVAATLADPAVTVTIAEGADGTLAGYVQLRDGGRPEPGARLDPARFPPDARTLEVARLYVDPPFHGRGVAQTLLAHARGEAARTGRLLWLGVYTLNPRAIAFYRKSGMTEAGVQTFTMGDDPQTDWVMVYPI